MGGKCENCKKSQMALQRKSENGSSFGTAPPIVYEVLRSPGQPLDAATRAFMEPRFGHDFSRVRVHADAQAAKSARAVNALAYTVGRDIAFSEGSFAPTTVSGKQLLAHELVHTMQQGKGVHASRSVLNISQPHDAAEQEADLAVAKIDRKESFVQPSNHVATLARRQPDAGASPSADAGTASASAKCALNTPKDCATYEDWLDTFPATSFAASVGSDKEITHSMPADLVGLISGKLHASGGLPDCADVALVLRHYYLKSRGQSFTFMVGRDKKTALTYTLGKATSDKEARVCMLGTGTESFQETRSGFALVNFYKEKGKNILNLKTLLSKGLKPGDMFVWKRLASIKGNFQGHAQTVQTVSPPKLDPKHPKTVTQDGFIAVVQGNMHEGQGKGVLQQRVYSFDELTGKPDGDADIGKEPKSQEESFFGSGPWKT